MTTRLGRLLNDIGACTICKDRPLALPLPHEPRPVIVATSNARICIAGQAPGTRVHASGIPFNDPSGDRLRQWLAVDRDAFYDPAKFAIVPMGFCFPGLDAKGSDLPPRRECVATWHDSVFALMPQIELLLVIGQYAQAYHLGKQRGRTLTETVRNWRDTWDRSDRPRRLPLPHPSWRNTGWLKKNPWFEHELLPVLRHEVDRLIS